MHAMAEHDVHLYCAPISREKIGLRVMASADPLKTVVFTDLLENSIAQVLDFPLLRKPHAWPLCPCCIGADAVPVFLLRKSCTNSYERRISLDTVWNCPRCRIDLWETGKHQAQSAHEFLDALDKTSMAINAAFDKSAVVPIPTEVDPSSTP